jgi:hydrogenase-4 component B
MSGVVLNAAFFAFGRAITGWMGDAGPWLGAFLLILAVVSAALTALNAFQSDDWRRLLSFSSAENAAIATAMLGTSMLFRAGGEARLAGFAWAVALLHLAAHALAKGGLFLAADGVYRATGSYSIRHNHLLVRAAWPFGLGALFAAASLAAMPPQAGFVSEWYVLQTVFQGFHFAGLGARLTLAVAGAGLALTVAIAFATFVKLFGIGLLGRQTGWVSAVPGASVAAVACLGACGLALAVGMPHWLQALGLAVSDRFGADTVAQMVVGWDLVPATGGPLSPETSFAFISPSKLVIAMPLLSLIPILAVLLARRLPLRRVPVWYGGFPGNPARDSTTAPTFSNALRVFYSFVYRPTAVTVRQTSGQPYIVRSLAFDHSVVSWFGPWLFSPVARLVTRIAAGLRPWQPGNLNAYLGLIFGLLLVILAASLAVS